MKVTLILAGIALLLASLIPTTFSASTSTSATPTDGLSSALEVLRQFGERGPVEATDSFQDEDSRFPTRNVSVTFGNGQTYFIVLTHDGTQVLGITAETRRQDRLWFRGRALRTPILSDASKATAFLEGLATSLYPGLPLKVEEVSFSTDKVQEGRTISAGRLTARLTRRFGGLRFVDRTIAAGVEIDPLDKGLISFTGMRPAPDVADLSIRITRDEAIRAWALKHGRPESELSALTSELGLAVAPGETKARPCWTFYRSGTRVPITFVDCKTKTVFEIGL